jgi:peptide deformylase
MSEILTIDTSDGLVTEEKIEPLPLMTEDHPMLRQKIPDYKGKLPIGAMTNLIKRLKMTMKLYGGVGLSANQCGVFERVFVIGTDDFQLACVNPKIVEVEGEPVKNNEGCLSYPGLFLKIDRPSVIIAEWYDENGELKRARLSGITAQCFQHELDHMNGIRFTEHVGPVALKLARQKQIKTIKKIVRKQKNGL